MAPLTLWASFFKYVQDGGFVMPPLVVATLLLWFGLGWRLITLQRGSRRSLRAQLKRRLAEPELKTWGIIDAAVSIAARTWREDPRELAPRLDERFGALRDRMRRFEILVRSVVMVAPLTGLLGTVTGMIETFDSLADMSLFSQSGGIAGGISQALITTQMGLAVAIPGLIFGRVLERKQARLAGELDELVSLMTQLKEEAARDEV